jgi:NCAIR mutase (PurE)-related protein
MDINLGYAVIDAERTKRTGAPETVYCEGKTLEQAEGIMIRMRDAGIPVLGTRANAALAEKICSRYREADYDEGARVLRIGRAAEPAGSAAVVCAGTSDLSVAREAALTAEFFGTAAFVEADVGVAGIHRLFARLDKLRSANVIVAVAGMEGALAGVIAGLVSVPVIACPTSVGYGASFGGLSALLGMITSCAPGIATVNIDNGFGAGYLAHQINTLALRGNANSIQPSAQKEG